MTALLPVSSQPARQTGRRLSQPTTTRLTTTRLTTGCLTTGCLTTGRRRAPFAQVLDPVVILVLVPIRQAGTGTRSLAAIA